MAAAAAPALIGAYGKIPALGDFVRRRLPLSFVDPWDAWLQEGLAGCRETMAPHWIERYLSGPLWRFALSPGLAGERAVAGVLMPSVDAANRHFPLTIAAIVGDPGSGPFAIAPSATAWFAAAEALALSTLNERFSGDDLEAGLDALDWTAAAAAPLPSPLPLPRSIGGRLHWSLALVAVGSAIDPLVGAVTDPAALLDSLCRDRFGGYAVFWTAGSDAVEPGITVGPGLPCRDAFALLFDDDTAGLPPPAPAATAVPAGVAAPP